MKKIPNEVNSLTGMRMRRPYKIHPIMGTLLELEKRFIDGYIINKDEIDEQTVLITESLKNSPSDKIIDDSREFVNGFKVVQTANKEYAYVRQSDNELLPFRYDLAFDFNQYGFAMVALDSKPTWIDKTFKMVAKDGKQAWIDKPFRMVAEDFDDLYTFDSLLEVNSFSKGDIPLSRICANYGGSKVSCYLGTNGELKKFYRYDGDLYMSDDYAKTDFIKGTNFDENGYATYEDGILSAKGYFITNMDLVKLCYQKGFVTSIGSEADKCFDRKIQKINSEKTMVKKI